MSTGPLSSSVPTTSQVVGGVYNATSPAPSSGQVCALQLDANGNLLVNIAAGAASGTQYVDGVTQLTPTGTAALGKNSSNVLHTLSLDASGNLNVNLAAGSITGGNAAAAPTGSAVPASADYLGFNLAGNLIGVSAANPLPVVQTAAIDVSDRLARLLGHVTVDNASLAVTGTFFQATQPVSLAATISDDVVDRAARLLGHVTVDNAAIAVTGTFFQATQPVSIAAAVDVSDRAARLLGVVYGSQGQQIKQTATNFNSQVELATGGTLYDARQTRALTSSDVVTAAQTTASNLNATVVFPSAQHVIIDSATLGTVTVAGTVTANQGGAPWSDDVTDRAARLLGHVTVDNASLAVTGTFFQATQPVSIAATISDDVVDRSARLLGHVTVDNFPATQPVSGTISVSNFPTLQPISAASLPLPVGAATDASLVGGNDVRSQQMVILESMRRALVAIACDGGRNNPRDFDPTVISAEEGIDDYAD